MFNITSSLNRSITIRKLKVYSIWLVRGMRKRLLEAVGQNIPFKILTKCTVKGVNVVTMFPTTETEING